MEDDKFLQNKSLVDKWLNITWFQTHIEIIPGLYDIYLNDKHHNDEKNMTQIQLDLNRTFPNHSSFRSEKIKKLQNILYVWTKHDPKIGYVQGMNFIIGTLLHYTNNEEKVFWLFLRLMEGKPFTISSKHVGLKSLFLDKLPGLFVTIYQLHKGLEILCPKLNHRFIEDDISLVAWIPQWIMSLFTKYFEPGKLTIFFTSFFQGGYLFLLKMMLCILQTYQTKLIQMSKDEIVLFLNPTQSNAKCIWNEIKLDKIIEKVSSMAITKRHLHIWDTEYHAKLDHLTDDLEVIEQLRTHQFQQYKKKIDQEKAVAIGGSIVGVGLLLLGGALIGNRMIRNRRRHSHAINHTQSDDWVMVSDPNKI